MIKSFVRFMMRKTSDVENTFYRDETIDDVEELLATARQTARDAIGQEPSEETIVETAKFIMSTERLKKEKEMYEHATRPSGDDGVPFVDQTN